MSNSARCLKVYQGEDCVGCRSVSRGISGFISPLLVETMAEGGKTLFPEGVQIPERDTPEYI